jgi:toxin CcdB
MEQFSLYINTDEDTNTSYPYFVDVQTEMLDALTSRVVIPLTTVLSNRNLPTNICPKIDINGEQFYLLTHQITTVSRSFLSKREGSITLNREDIINSIDFLFSGI